MLIRNSFDVTNIQSPSFLFIESTLLSCFEDFKKYQTQNSFMCFEKELETTNFKYVFDKYPVAEHILMENERKKSSLLSIIYQTFEQDFLPSQQSFLLNVSSDQINNIKIGVGDFHNGMSTAIIELNSRKKIIFKPTESHITEAFFFLLDWVDLYYSLGNYRYQIKSNNNYHWLEFVDHIHCQSTEELQIYYERAGFVLGILYILNAVDFHYENIIAKGTTPVVIDHETIIQPQINTDLQKFFKNFISKNIDESVLSTMLLPIKDGSIISIPTGACGFGYHKQKSMQTIKKEAVDRYTDNWRLATKFSVEDFQKENLPVLDNNAVYPIEFIDDFIMGFEKAYHLFISNRDFLLNDKKSPLYKFTNSTVRFIWRPTNIYDKINKHMKAPENLVNFEHYEKKINDYLMVAFKNVPKESDLMFIHKHEVAQMLRGDIPFFEVNSSSRDLPTEFGVIKDFFELSAVENIDRKLKKLSLKDLEYQIKIIRQSYQ